MNQISRWPKDGGCVGGAGRDCVDVRTGLFPITRRLCTGNLAASGDHASSWKIGKTGFAVVRFRLSAAADSRHRAFFLMRAFLRRTVLLLVYE
jgi:hypothetical protein